MAEEDSIQNFGEKKNSRLCSQPVEFEQIL